MQSTEPQKMKEVTQIFSLTRDIDSVDYVQDGDLDMYNEQNLQLRQQLRNKQTVQKQILNFLSLYKGADQVVEKEYKRIQRIIAKVLRPEMDQQELQFVVDKDWEHDAKGNSFITKAQLTQGLFELVDVWTEGVSQIEYTSFLKLLKKKVQRFKS